MDDDSRSHSAQAVDCLRCRHFQITWEADHPRACRAMGFKTALWPWQEVLRSSGHPCLKFEPKTATPSRDARMEDGQSDALSSPGGGFSKRV
ncbi:MAG: hypothetical protein HQL99_06005 [Magnetococcales bacterium]|nr:hypothetical protein [Magnetococcales bacterium]